MLKIIDLYKQYTPAYKRFIYNIKYLKDLLLYIYYFEMSC